MSTVTAPLTTIALAALVPDIVRSCVVLQPSPPPDPGEEPPAPVTGNDIYTPIAPGVTYANLPVAPTIVDTSPDQMIGCIVTVADNPQGRLNALFPSAISGDGVIDRATNDIWVYDGATWNNVGPTPGPTITATVVIPPWNETLLAVARTRTKLSVNALAYALELLTEPDPIITTTALKVYRVMPVVDLTLTVPTPAISSGVSVATPVTNFTLGSLPLDYVGPFAVVIQTPTHNINLNTHNPSIYTGASVLVSKPVYTPLDQVVIPFEGTNGATSVVSEDLYEVSVALLNGAALTTSNPNTGSTCAVFAGPGTLEQAEFNLPKPLGTDDFCVEFFVRISSAAPTYSTLFAFENLDSIDYDPDVQQFVVYFSGSLPTKYHEGATVLYDQYQHIAIYRSSGYFYLAIDGVVWTGPPLDNIDYTGTLCRIADWDGAGGYEADCNVDDLRITFGNPVYGASDFTPPVAPFPVLPQNTLNAPAPAVVIV